MLKQLEQKSANRNYRAPVVVIACCAIVAGFYLANRETDQSFIPPATLTPESAANSAMIGPATSPSPFVSRVQSSERTIESGGIAESLPEEHVRHRQLDVPGFSVDEVKLLHERQQHEVAQRLSDLDAVVIESQDGAGAGLTVGKLRSLQEQQRELDAANTWEVVIPAGEDGSPALTVADLRAMHEQQERALEATTSADEVVIDRSLEGTSPRTQAGIIAQLERQRIGLESDAGADYPAPDPGAGSPYTTVEEVRNLHEKQSRE